MMTKELTKWRKIILRPQLLDRPSSGRNVMNMLCTKFIRYKFVVWCTFQCSWDTSIPPFVEAVYSSGDIDCPTFLADLDLRQSLVILRASTCCKSSAEVWVGNTEEF